MRFGKEPNADSALQFMYTGPRPTRCERMISNRMPKMLLWLVAVTLAALLVYVAFRGYLSPESLIGFANLFVC